MRSEIHKLKPEDLEETIADIGYPIVIKPLDGNHGKGASINVTNWDDAVKGLKHAKEYSRRVIVEKFITGFDFRILVINNEVIAAAQRVPAHVIGNGKNTIQELIDITNEDPRRGYGHENVLTKITTNELTQTIIKDAGYALDSVIAKGERLILKDTANLSTGGTAEDITDIIHPANIAMAERISKIIDLD